jgi:outer membrane lipoprotein-sorting protein
VGKILHSTGLLIGTLIFLFVVVKAGQSKSVDEILAEIESTGRSIHTFRADFVQKKEVALFASALTSRGKLIVKSPDLLIWKVLEPLEAFFFVDRGVAGTRNPNTGEVRRFKISGQGIDPSYNWLLRVFMGSLRELKKSFNIELADGDETTTLRLRLIPLKKGPKAGVREILLGFDPNRLYVNEIIFKEASGDRTEISLMNVMVNEEIGEDIPSWLREGGNQ